MSEERYDQLVEAARADERVLGLILTGSRGRESLFEPMRIGTSGWCC
jgi:hypothetical protein